MKLTAILIVALTLHVSATGYSQNTRLSLNIQNTSVKDVLRQIEEQTDYRFIYTNEAINLDRKVDLRVNNKKVEEVLDELFRNEEIRYSITEKNLILINPLDKNEVENLRMQNLMQQDLTLKGKVTDNQGQPLPGVTVVVKGTTQGTITDADGNYFLTQVAGNATLVFSFVGMKTQEVEVGGRQDINIVIEEETIGLEEVVAIGYGTQKKVNIVGSVTTVEGDKIASIPSADVSNAISGRLPGAIVTQGTGEPGQNAAKILIRGRTTLGDDDEYTDPLVVIDGVPGRSLSEIDPIDIASISVLKDAAAAIYGASAANGVILVTTKKGESGKPRFSYQFYEGFMTPTKLPDVLNAGDYATMLSEYQDYENAERTYSDEDIELYYSGKDPWKHPDTDWMDDLVDTWSMTSKHNITIDGGQNGMTYFVSMGYKKETAIYKADNSTRYKQYNLRAKLEFPIADWLKTSIDYGGFITDKLYPTKSADDVYGQATRLVPTQWSYWPNGKPGPDIEYGDNPVVTSTLETGYDKTRNYKNQLTFTATITPPMVKGLTLSGYYSYDIDNQYHKEFQKPWTLYYPNWDTAVYGEDGYITDMELIPTARGVDAPQLTEDYDRSTRQLSNINLTYNRQFGDHEMTVFGSYEELKEDWNNFEAYREHYTSDVVETLDAGSETDKDNSGTMSVYARKSWIGRFNYSYKGKYLGEFQFRRDGSLKFKSSDRWGNYWAVMLGWRASEESFWKRNLSFINYFKLRASYGKIGMDPGDAFQYLNKYNLSSGMTTGTGKTVQTVVVQANVANPNITWEKQDTYNVGFDSQFLNNKIHLNADFFYNERSDILTARNASVPNYTGLELPDENIGKVKNHGFEIDAGYHKQVNSNLRYDIATNISYTHNEVKFMDEPAVVVPWQEKTGHSYGAELLYNAIGIFKDQAAVDAYPHWAGAKPGDVIFEDVSGDGEITSDDQILLDHTDSPEIFYGISFDLTYKNWSISLLAQGQGKFYAMNVEDERRGEAGNYFQWSFDDRWTPTHTDARGARAYNRNDQYWAFENNNSTYHYDNMAYLRLKNAVISYNIPKRLFGNTGISGASVYFSGNNLFMIYSAQDNFDPENAAPMSYPSVRTFAIGAKITF